MTLRALLITASVLAPLPDTHARAQDISGDEAYIIIAAMRKGDPLHTAPLSASYIKGAHLEALEMHDLKTLQSMTPSLLITSTANEAQTTARLRGVGTVGDNPGLDSSVGVMIDGVMRARTATAMGDLGPIERVEVLKGPQSGLYGKGSSAGLILVHTKAPDGTNRQALDLSLGDYNTKAISGYIEAALFEGLFASLSVTHRKRDGQYHIKTGDGPRTDDQDNTQNYDFARAQLVFMPDAQFRGRFIADYTHHVESCCSGVGISLGATRTYIDQLSIDEGTAPFVNPKGRQAYLNRSTRQVITEGGLSFEAVYRFENALNLYSVTALRHWDHRSGYDADFTSADIYYRDPDGSFGNRFETLSQELRLEGAVEDLNYVLGLYGQDEKLVRHDQYLYGHDYESYVGLLLSGGADINRVLSLTGRPAGTSFVAGEGANDRHSQKTQDLAVFALAEYRLNAHFTAFGNMRLNRQTKHLSSHYTTSDQGIACASATAKNASGLGVLCLPWSNPAFSDLRSEQNNDSTASTGSMRLRYQNARHMAYMAYATGWKGAGFQLDREQLPTYAADPDTYFKPETSESFELGYRYQYGAAYGSLTAFDERFKNFQLNTFIGTTFLVRSVPHLMSKGLELEGHYAFGEFNLSGGVTYNEAKFGPEPVAGLPLLAQNTPSFAPRWSGVLGGDWHRAYGKFTLTATFNARHLSAYNTGSDLASIKVQKAYSLYNGALAIGSEESGWQVSLWGQNLTDVLYYQVAFSAPFQAGTYNAFVGQPRTLGLTLRLKR